MLRATTACTFSTSQLPKVVRTRCVLYILTSTCASRHNGVHFLDISTSKSGPTWVCFVHFDFKFTTACTFSCLIWPAGSAPAALASLLFDPPEPQILEKHSESRLSYLFAHLHLLSSDLFSSDSSHLCFSTAHIVGSFTSKLPSIILSPKKSKNYHDFREIVGFSGVLWGVSTTFKEAPLPTRRWQVTASSTFALRKPGEVELGKIAPGSSDFASKDGTIDIVNQPN